VERVGSRIPRRSGTGRVPVRSNCIFYSSAPFSAVQLQGTNDLTAARCAWC
jgi:hypothetical protein